MSVYTGLFSPFHPRVCFSWGVWTVDRGCRRGREAWYWDCGVRITISWMSENDLHPSYFSLLPCEIPQDEKKRKRAERFGITSEEEKLQKRLQRFATNPRDSIPTPITPRVKVSGAWRDARKVTLLLLLLHGGGSRQGILNTGADDESKYWPAMNLLWRKRRQGRES